MEVPRSVAVKATSEYVTSRSEGADRVTAMVRALDTVPEDPRPAKTAALRRTPTLTGGGAPPPLSESGAGSVSHIRREQLLDDVGDALNTLDRIDRRSIDERIDELDRWVKTILSVFETQTQTTNNLLFIAKAHRETIDEIKQRLDAIEESR